MTEANVFKELWVPLRFFNIAQEFEVESNDDYDDDGFISILKSFSAMIHYTGNICWRYDYNASLVGRWE